MGLSETQRSAFFRDGYIVIKNLISPDELEILRENYANLVLGRVPDFPERHVSRHNPQQTQTLEAPTPHGGRHNRRNTQVFPKGEDGYEAQRKAPVKNPLDAINKVNVPSRYDPVFDAFVQSPKIVDVVADLMGSNIKLYYDQVFAKPPYARANRYHQDSVFWSFLRATSKLPVSFCSTMQLWKTAVSVLFRAATTSG